MMKNIKRILVVLILFVVLSPITVYGKGKTLKDFKNELAALESKQQENQRISDQTISQINSKRNEIQRANDNIAENEKNVEQAKKDVEQGKIDIKKTTEELNDLFSYTQTVDEEKVYLQYIAEANNITDLIERSAIIEQLSNYETDELGRLEKLIKDNEELQVSLSEENEKLEESITSYEKKIDELNKYLSSVASIGLDYAEQVKAQKQLIKIYQDAGCKDSDYVDDCYYNRMISASQFIRPLTSGTITQAYGTNGHYGMDIGGNASGTPIYASAPGIVASVSYKNRCGGNIVHIHHVVNGVSYTSEYAHMLTINVKVGDTVTAATQIGGVGGGSNTWSYDSCTTGVHLHYTISYGHYLGSGANSYSSYRTFQTKSTPTGDAAITGIKNQRYYRFTTRY